MKEEDAIKKFSPTPDATTFRKMFIKSLYKEGYTIITPEEDEKINGVLLLAQIHGMNPFDKKEKQ